jgi:hypothetical protein
MVRLKAQMLNDLFDTVDWGHQTKDEKLLHEIYSQLINVRPTLFHFTVEASDKQEQEMVEILALNDRLNSIINRHNNFGKFCLCLIHDPLFRKASPFGQRH